LFSEVLHHHSEVQVGEQLMADVVRVLVQRIHEVFAKTFVLAAEPNVKLRFEFAELKICVTDK
jgi:hypothetical protein